MSWGEGLWERRGAATSAAAMDAAARVRLAVTPWLGQSQAGPVLSGAGVEAVCAGFRRARLPPA